VAIIPARGGSKSVPGKNLRIVGGLSLVARSVSAAKGSPVIDLVVVSTDSDEVAIEAAAHGARVVRRPDELSGDTASSELALLHCLSELEKAGIAPQIVVLVQCTSPFVTSDDISRTVAAVVEGADSAFTAYPSHAFLWTFDGNSAASVNHKAFPRPRRQDRQQEYIESGAVYAMDRTGFLAAGHRFFGRTVLVTTDPARSMQIDDPADLHTAQVLARHLDMPRLFAALPKQPGALVLDFDGVMTDDGVITFDDGREAVIANRRDGMGIEILRRHAPDFPVCVLSTETNPVVEMRCRKLGVTSVQGLQEKSAALVDWCMEHGVDVSNVVYVGNDINDLGCMALVGCAVAPADAHELALAAAQLVLSASGGRGVVREICDLLIESGRLNRSAIGESV
jgi:YrbI family 3-deoxy-D-manno-octulosonate 8-phosphate phosphatase